MVPRNSVPIGSRLIQPPGEGGGGEMTVSATRASWSVVNTGSTSGRWRFEGMNHADRAPTMGSRTRLKYMGYSLRAESREVSMDENSLLMWLMTMPMTKMPTSRSRSAPNMKMPFSRIR